MRQQEVFHGYSAQLLATLLGDSEIRLPVTSTSSFKVKNLPGITKRQKVALLSKISAKHTLSEDEIISHLLIKESFRNTNLPREITDVIANLWKTTTRTQKESVLREWFVYGISWNRDPCTPEVNTVLSFMQSMYINSCSCSGLCAAPNALSNTVTIKGCTRFSEHPFISWDLKIIYNIIDINLCLNILVSGTYHLH